MFACVGLLKTGLWKHGAGGAAADRSQRSHSAGEQIENIPKWIISISQFPAQEEVFVWYFFDYAW